MHLVIIGNGAAALSALNRFRSLDRDSNITLISAEPGAAYSRVLLPYYLRKTIPYANLYIRGAEDYAKLDVKTKFGVGVSRVDCESRALTLEDGGAVHYDKLLIATGSRPFLPPIPGLAGEGVHHLWTLADTERLDSLFQPGRRALVLGSGFIALQAAWAAKQRGLRVTIYELLSRIMPTVLDREAASLLHEKIDEQGVQLRLAVRTERVERSADGSLTVYADDGPPLQVDLIVVATGVRPNIDFLEGSPIRTERGIPVDRYMQSSYPGVYAAGDVARAATVFGETHQTHALWPTAVEHGRIAGSNLAGTLLPYRGSLNMNVTEMFGITVASMGRFIEEEGSVSRILERQGSGYLKIVLQQDLPVGAIALGGSEQVAVLGRLRPWIRHHRRLPDIEGFARGKYLFPGRVA